MPTPRLGTLLPLVLAAFLGSLYGQQTPSKEYIRLNGRVVAIENPSQAGTPLAVTIQSVPAGRLVAIDNEQAQVTPFTVTWDQSVAHVLRILEPTQPQGTDTRFNFQNWDGTNVCSGGGNTCQARDISVGATATTYTASFQAQHRLQISTQGNPSGTVATNPTGETGGWFTQGTTVCLTASPATGAQFSQWTGSPVAPPTGGCSGTQGQITMDQPRAITANFIPVGDVSVTINRTDASGSAISVPITVDTQTVTGFSSTFTWSGNSTHPVTTGTYTTPDGYVQYVFLRWEDGTTTLPRQVSVGTNPSYTFTAIFDTYYRVTTTASPSGGGSATPASVYVKKGLTQQIVATPNTGAGYQFSGWSGATLAGSTSHYTGPTTNPTLTINGAISQTAVFASNLAVTPTWTGLRVNQSTTFAVPAGGVLSWTLESADGISGTPGTLTNTNSTNATYTAPSTISQPRTLRIRATSSTGSATATIYLSTANYTPRFISSNPVNGSGTSQLFTWVYYDDDGIADFLQVQQTFGPSAISAPSTNTCYTIYLPQSNTVVLFDNAGNYGPNGVLGSVATLQNSQCIVDLAQSSVDLSIPNYLKLNLHISFKPGFYGGKYHLVKAWDQAGHQTVWTAAGFWDIPAGDITPPIITLGSVSPLAETTATVNWTTNEVSDTQLEYGVSTSYGLTTPLVSTLTLSHAVALSGLQPSTTYYFRARSADAVGNVATATGNFTTNSSSSAPTTVSVTPSSGNASSQTFSAVYRKSGGYAGLTQADLLIGTSSTNFSNSCYINLDRATNNIRLLLDNGSSWSSTTTLVSGEAIENSQCLVDPKASSSSGSGNDLTLSLKVYFKPGFAGAKNLYLRAHDSAADSGWVDRGDFTATASSAPVVLSASPSALSGTSAQTVTFRVFDPQGGLGPETDTTS